MNRIENRSVLRPLIALRKAALRKASLLDLQFMSVKHNEQFEAEQMEAIQNMGKHENETSSLQMNNSKGGTGEVIRRASSASIAKIRREVCTFSARA